MSYLISDPLHKYDTEREEFRRVCYMLRVDPKEVHTNVMRVGTIGLPHKNMYTNKKHFKRIEEESIKDKNEGRLIWY